MRIEIPTSWTIMARHMMEVGGTVMMLGARDTGKSTFASWLAAHAATHGIETWLVDADVGQSDVGPPSTVGAARVPPGVSPLRDPARSGAHVVQALPASDLWFVGSHSPRSHMLDCVVGTARLADKARSQGARMVIVNTTGWIEGGGAAALKTAKIDLVRPRFLVAFERDGELQDVLAPWTQAACLQIVRCNVSDAVCPRSQEARIEARRERWARYLRAAREIVIDTTEVGISGGRRDRLSDPASLGCAVGLLDQDGECAGVGPLVRAAVTDPLVRVLAPIPEGQAIARIHVGSVVIPGFEADVALSPPFPRGAAPDSTEAPPSGACEISAIF